MMFTMQYVNRLDQNDPVVVWWSRFAFLAYLVVSAAIYVFLTDQVWRKRDQRQVVVRSPPNPFAASEANGPESSVKTVQQYDSEMISQGKRGLLFNTVLVSIIHVKMGTISPLLMAVVMGLTRYLDDPQVKLHLLGYRDEGPLQRPFKSENPLAKLLGMEESNPQPAGEGNPEAAGRATRLEGTSRIQGGPNQGSERAREAAAGDGSAPEDRERKKDK